MRLGEVANTLNGRLELQKHRIRSHLLPNHTPKRPATKQLLLLQSLDDDTESTAGAEG